MTAAPWYQKPTIGPPPSATPDGRQLDELKGLEQSGQPSCAKTDHPRDDWYGAHADWVLPFQATARRRYGDHLRSRLLPGLLTYELADLPVRGRREPANVIVRFHAQPPYETYGLEPQDFPRVHADPGKSSPHRMPRDDALCLFYPLDPLELRWHARWGLLSLFDVIADHLFCEEYWRTSGGWSGGQWPGEEAPHGFPTVGARGLTARRGRR